MLPGLFIVGTDTGVGKTLVASRIIKALVHEGRRVGALKPIATGAIWNEGEWRSEDVEQLRSAIGREVPIERVGPLVYELALAPCVAARLSGHALTSASFDRTVKKAVDWWSERSDILVVEGIGGFLCPLTETTTVADLAVKLDYPLVVVARRGLGTLSHTLMTVEAARWRGLRVAGIVLNAAEQGPSPLAEVTNARELARRLHGIAILAEIPHSTQETLHDPPVDVDWFMLALTPRRRPEKAVTTVPSPISSEEVRQIMPSDVIEPGAGPGAAGPEAFGRQSFNSEGPGAPRSPADPLVNSTSGDELSVILTQASPDPLLGEYDHPLPSGSEDSPPESSGHERRDALNALSDLKLSATDMARIPVPSGISPSSTEAIAALDLGEPSPVVPHPDRPTDSRPAAKPPEDDDSESRGIPLSTLLLASYASAVTFGLIWVLWSGRRLKETVEPEPAPVLDARPDPGRRSQNARKIVPPPPIAAEHLTGLGKTIRLGVIEVTPLGVSSGPVTLTREFNRQQRKSGGDDALNLLLRFKNTSTETLLAPMDEAFLRVRPGSDPESYIDTQQEGASIPLYALAVESEWSIAGQDFRELRPGESFETRVTSAPDALDKLTSEMTWRIRLRTGINHTDDLGVRFHKDDVVAEPRRKSEPSGKK